MSTDPRGPERTILAIARGELPEHIGYGDAWLLTLDCGHISYGSNHMWFKVGSTHHCLQCKREAATS
jgi:hypothetical protein